MCSLSSTTGNLAKFELLFWLACSTVVDDLAFLGSLVSQCLSLYPPLAALVDCGDMGDLFLRWLV